MRGEQIILSSFEKSQKKVIIVQIYVDDSLWVHVATPSEIVCKTHEHRI